METHPEREKTECPLLLSALRETKGQPAWAFVPSLPLEEKHPQNGSSSFRKKGSKEERRIFPLQSRFRDAPEHRAARV